MGNSVSEASIKKLKLLVTVVDRPKAEFYLDYISQFEVNCQMALQGKGTVTSDLIEKYHFNSCELYNLLKNQIYQLIY